MEITIARHCVDQQANGLSSLQNALMADPRRIRIAAAPTGAGKSYAFQRALLEQGHRILWEVLTDAGRPLHGDVKLGLVEENSLQGLIGQHLDRIRSEIAADRQVVVIYDTLAALQRDLHPLARRLAAADMALDRVLVINSIDDSGPDGRHPCGFYTGRRQDPDAFDMVLATSSVELGMTFREARFMIMEPGFKPLNFLQRYGRAARRGVDGEVLVRFAVDLRHRHPWLRTLWDWVGQHREERMTIDDLTGLLAEEGLHSFGSLSKRAVYCAGLYWQLLLDHPSNRAAGRRRHLLDCQPDSSRQIFALLQTVGHLEKTEEYRKSVRFWIHLFKGQARYMRDIGPRIRIVQADGRSNEVDEVWLWRETTILEKFPLGGNNEVHVTGNLDDFFREEKPYGVKRLWIACFPHTHCTKELAMDDALLDAWCRQLQEIDPYTFAWDDHPEAFEAVKQLIKLTGLVPGYDPDLSMESISAVL